MYESIFSEQMKMSLARSTIFVETSGLLGMDHVHLFSLVFLLTNYLLTTNVNLYQYLSSLSRVSRVHCGGAWIHWHRSPIG